MYEVIENEPKHRTVGVAPDILARKEYILMTEATNFAMKLRSLREKAQREAFVAYKNAGGDKIHFVASGDPLPVSLDGRHAVAPSDTLTDTTISGSSTSSNDSASISGLDDVRLNTGDFVHHDGVSFCILSRKLIPLMMTC